MSQRNATNDWKKVRKLILASQPKGRYRGSFVEFNRVSEEPGYVDEFRLMTYLGIRFHEGFSGTNASCWCGSPYARWEPSTRRFVCPKTKGCGINHVDLTRLVFQFVERGGVPKPLIPASSSNKTALPTQDYSYVD